MAVDEARLLSLWEQGQARQPLDRALLMLWGLGGRRDAATLTLGARDAALLALRAEHFGAVLQATAACPHCGQAMAFELPLRSLGETLAPADAALQVSLAEGVYRLPTSADLAAALHRPEPRAALALALRVQGDGTLDEAALATIEAALREADPASQIDIALTCQACGNAFESPMDPGECLWHDVQRQAQHTLDDVHALASAYGWSEAEVLAVPPTRRQHYLQRVLA
jgi:hypothetical protein